MTLPIPAPRVTPAKRYPAGPITPQGAYHLLKGSIPTVKLRAYDDSIVFNLMGGESIPDRTMPERVEIKTLKGLIPPWKQIKQKGATQDGQTFVTSLYDPCEIEMQVVVRGRDPIWTRQVQDDLIASIDAIQTSELSWITKKMGRWWSKVRWMSAPADPLEGVFTSKQLLSLRLIAFDALWRSYDYVTQFRLGYTNMQDIFNYTTASGGLGTGWQVSTTGAGTGDVYADGSQISNTLSSNRTTVAKRVGYTSATDNQVVEMDLGTMPNWYFDSSTHVDFWLRMLNTATTPGTDGVRIRLGAKTITLSSFAAGVETVLRSYPLNIPPKAGDQKWMAIAGTPDDPRVFKLLRNGAPVFTFKETGTTSHIGSTYRSSGLGLHTSSTITPIGIRRWSGGDNSVATQSGFIDMMNVGDQPLYQRFTCFGPGTFGFGNGPNSPDMVFFGPLLAGQAAQIRTHPGKRGVTDLSVTPQTQQAAAQFGSAITDLLSFASFANTGQPGNSQFLDVFQSVFGLLGGAPSPVPPQGNMYSLLQGRFSNWVPAKSPGKPAVPYQIPVQISGGTADSLIIAAGTPLRRQPY